MYNMGECWKVLYIPDSAKAKCVHITAKNGRAVVQYPALSLWQNHVSSIQSSSFNHIYHAQKNFVNSYF